MWKCSSPKHSPGFCPRKCYGKRKHFWFHFTHCHIFSFSQGKTMRVETLHCRWHWQSLLTSLQAIRSFCKFREIIQPIPVQKLGGYFGISVSVVFQCIGLGVRFLLSAGPVSVRDYNNTRSNWRQLVLNKSSSANKRLIFHRQKVNSAGGTAHQ